MPKIEYKSKRFTKSTLEILGSADTILDKYQEKGYDLTLRQLYYQFVARNILPNNQKSYKRLGKIISDGRLAGLINWTYVVDRTRSVRKNSHWELVKDSIASTAKSFRMDIWKEQTERVEVWIEKDALVGVIAPVCTKLDVPYFSCRGYVSQSELWKATKRFSDYWDEYGQKTIILYLGDHDPSGLNMVTDITNRLEILRKGITWFTVEVKPIALNIKQIRELKLPPNPAKTKDSRIKEYYKLFGNKCWELDALEPDYLSELVSQKIRDHVDYSCLKKAEIKQEKKRGLLNLVAKHWEAVSDFVKGLDQ